VVLTAAVCSLPHPLSLACPPVQVYYEGKKAMNYDTDFYFYDMMLVSHSPTISQIRPVVVLVWYWTSCCSSTDECCWLFRSQPERRRGQFIALKLLAPAPLASI
jgi:hypothetical protein